MSSARCVRRYQHAAAPPQHQHPPPVSATRARPTNYLARQGTAVPAALSTSFPRTHFVQTIWATSIRPSGSSCNAPHRDPPAFIAVRPLVSSRSSAFTLLKRSVACVPAPRTPKTPQDKTNVKMRYHQQTGKRKKTKNNIDYVLVEMSKIRWVCRQQTYPHPNTSTGSENWDEHGS